MSSFASDHPDRLDELLCDSVTCGLSSSEQAELQGLLAGRADEAMIRMELTAAATALAVLSLGETTESLPGWLRDRIERDAPAARRRGGVIARLNWAPWALVAASLMLAALGWWPRLAGERRSVSPEILAKERGSVTTQWAAWSPKAPTEDPEAKPIDWSKGVQGRVVWNAERQEGFMFFSGMKPNDPREFQYQLWIIDAGHKHPVDGGVFDIPADVGSRDVVVRITPKIRVSDAAAFAVTMEKPGGVVVSDQHERVVVASVAK